MTAYSPDPRDLGPEVPRRPGAVRGRADGRDAAAADSLASRARYAAWDGSQEVADL
ncbi:MAG: hypothetical protein QOI37_522, partial [Chloroflexota bacterium]|nr:hypothetical protein [Chloroflexota bacterium]